MNLNYEEVPNIISCKDMDYLCDMFNWNYGAYKCSYNSIEKVEDEEIKEEIKKVNEVYLESMNKVLSILEGGQNE